MKLVAPLLVATALLLASCGGGTKTVSGTGAQTQPPVATAAHQQATALNCGNPKVKKGEVYAFDVTATGVDCKTALGVAFTFQNTCADTTLQSGKPCSVSGLKCKGGGKGPKNAVLVVCERGSRGVAFAYPQ